MHINFWIGQVRDGDLELRVSEDLGFETLRIEIEGLVRWAESYIEIIVLLYINLDMLTYICISI